MQKKKLPQTGISKVAFNNNLIFQKFVSILFDYCEATKEGEKIKCLSYSVCAEEIKQKVFFCSSTLKALYREPIT